MESDDAMGTGACTQKERGQTAGRERGWGASHYIPEEGFVQPYMVIKAMRTYNDACYHRTDYPAQHLGHLASVIWYAFACLCM